MKEINCLSSSDSAHGQSHGPLRACGSPQSVKSVKSDQACAIGCKMCGGGGNFTQPRTNKGRACGNNKRGNGLEGQPCELFTSKTKFACGYKCGWKGPKFWNFAEKGLQWGNHVGGDGSRASCNSPTKLVLGESAVCNTSTYLLEEDPTRPDPDDPTVERNLLSTANFIVGLFENYNLENNMGNYIEMPNIIINIRLEDGTMIARGGNMYKISENKKIYFKFSGDEEANTTFERDENNNLLITIAPTALTLVTLSGNSIVSQDGLPITQIDIVTSC